MFAQHPDGYIMVGDVLMPVAEFQVYEPHFTGLPVGAIGRIYEPGVRHALTDGHNTIGGPLPWPEGELYLAKVEVYRTRHPNFAQEGLAQAAFLASPQYVALQAANPLAASSLSASLAPILIA